MDTSLLSCIRGASARSKTASIKASKQRSVREALMSRIRILSPLVQIPIRIPQSARFYIPSKPRPNSKSYAVYRELVEAGIPEKDIWYPKREKNAKTIRLLRFILRLPWAISYIVIMLGRSRKLDRFALHATLGRELCRGLLKRYPGLHPIIISDVSPNLHMLWSAASVEGNRAIWWQDDFHHYQWLLPYQTKAAVILNEAGYRTVSRRVSRQRIFKRSTQKPVPTRDIPDRPVVGVATNAFFAASDAQRRTLDELKYALNCGELHLRLHPNSKLTSDDFPEDWLIPAPSDETIDQFAARVDIAVVGNSAVQIWLLSQGVPVVHVAGLDEHPFDLYGYVRERISFGQKIARSARIGGVREFYADRAYFHRFLRMVSVPGSCPVRALQQFPSILEPVS